MFPKQRERHVLHCCWEGKAMGPRRKQLWATQGRWPHRRSGKKKKNHARLMAQNSRASLDLKGTRQMGITPMLWVLVKITLVLVKISVDK